MGQSKKKKMGYIPPPPPPPKGQMGRLAPLPPPVPPSSAANIGQAPGYSQFVPSVGQAPGYSQFVPSDPNVHGPVYERAQKHVKDWNSWHAQQDLRGPKGHAAAYDDPNYVPPPPPPLPQDSVVWLLPDGEDRRPYALPEKAEVNQWAMDFASNEATLVKTTALTVESKSTRIFDPLIKVMANNCVSSIKKVGRTLLLGLAWIGFGYLIDRRLPEGMGYILTALGLVVIAYGAVRHGYAAWYWKHLGRKACYGMGNFLSTNSVCPPWGVSHAKQNGLVFDSTLLDALAEAIKYRATTPVEKMDDPNKGLLDAKSYEELSTKKKIPMEDIVRLGKTLDRETKGMSTREISDQFGVTLAAAAVYKDLADASLSLQGLDGMRIDGWDSMLLAEEINPDTEKKQPSKEQVH